MSFLGFGDRRCSPNNSIIDCVQTSSNSRISAFVSAGGSVSVCQRERCVYCFSLFLLLSAPRCLSFPVPPAGLRSLSSEALVGGGGKSAQLKHA